MFLCFRNYGFKGTGRLSWRISPCIGGGGVEGLGGSSLGVGEMERTTTVGGGQGGVDRWTGGQGGWTGTGG